jgi:putative (di)nucleoside polyphosphate hydrolase
MTPKPPTRYRRNVGIAVFNKAGRVLLAERCGNPGSWQMPQGGVDEGEEPWACALRELKEEIGTDNVSHLGEIEIWLRYDYPAGHHLSGKKQRYAGQEQKWFAVRFEGEDSEIDLKAGPEIEFSQWRWGTLAEAVDGIVDFKREVYVEMARHFARFEGMDD